MEHVPWKQDRWHRKMRSFFVFFWSWWNFYLLGMEFFLYSSHVLTIPLENSHGSQNSCQLLFFGGLNLMRFHSKSSEVSWMALKLFGFERFRDLKLSNLENSRTLKLSKLTTGTMLFFVFIRKRASILVKT